MTDQATPAPPQEPRLSQEMIAALMRSRLAATAAVNTYRSLLYGQAARVGVDADWLDGAITQGLRGEFARRTTPDPKNG